jgi:hypothetical protein
MTSLRTWCQILSGRCMRIWLILRKWVWWSETGTWAASCIFKLQSVARAIKMAARSAQPLGFGRVDLAATSEQRGVSKELGAGVLVRGARPSSLTS